MKDFLQAVIKNAKKDFGEEEKRRAIICSECNEKRKSFYSDIFNSIMKDVDGFVCTRCKPNCPISNKIFAQDKKNICDKWIQ